MKSSYIQRHFKTMKDTFTNSFNFKFELASTDIVWRYINETDNKKSSSGKISPAIIKLPKNFWYQSQTVLINVFRQNLSQMNWK